MYSEEISLEGSSNKEQQQVFQILQPNLINQQQNQVKQTPTISVKLNDYYVVLEENQANQQFSNQQQWANFLNKKINERANISFLSLSSILNVKYTQIQRRKNIWQAITKQQELKVGQQSNWGEYDAKIMKQINNNIEKMFKRVSPQKEFTNEQLKFLICHIISQFQQKENHSLATLKGLQYICYGIFVASPHKDFNTIKKYFNYFMNGLGLKQIFTHGSPLFYSQINLICQQIKSQSPELFNKLQSSQADESKIFIAYFRTLLINKIRKIQIISKIFELILVYGISIVRMILVRIISLKQQQLLRIQDPEQLMQTLATTLVFDQIELNLGEEIQKQTKKQQILKNTEQQKAQYLRLKKQKQSEKVVQVFRKIIIGI